MAYTDNENPGGLNQLAKSAVVPTADRILGWDASANELRYLPAYEVDDTLIVLTTKTADYSVLTTDVDEVLTLGSAAAATRTFTMPAATVHNGVYRFLNASASYYLRIAPAQTSPLSDNIAGTTAGKYLEMRTQGGYVEMQCMIAGIWTIRCETGINAFEV